MSYYPNDEPYMSRTKHPMDGVGPDFKWSVNPAALTPDPDFEYFTRDFYLAIAFLCSHVTLKRIEKINDRTGVFIFEKTDAIRHIINRWTSRELAMNLYDFTTNMKALRTQLNDVMHNN